MRPSRAAIAYAPYADLLWMETSTPDIDEARRFADAIHAKYPGKMLAYNCSPSFNWAQKLSADEIASFQSELGALGYKFQFVTLAGFHALNFSMFELARQYRDEGMTAYSRMQQSEFAAEEHGYTATKHQHEVGTGYFDEVMKVISNGQSSTTALAGSTEAAQFGRRPSWKTFATTASRKRRTSAGRRARVRSAAQREEVPFHIPRD